MEAEQAHYVSSLPQGSATRRQADWLLEDGQLRQEAK